jgi:hypothetical protein
MEEPKALVNEIETELSKIEKSEELITEKEEIFIEVQPQ